jgi:hypothetical protein
VGRRREAEIELGPYRYTIVPQKIGRLRHSLREAFTPGADDSDDALAEAEELAEKVDSGQGEDVVEQLGGQAHAVLGVFIPDLMPKYEWLGFATEQAMKDDAYVGAQDRSPDLDQIVEALETCMHVNRIDLVKHLKDLVSPDFRKAMVQKLIADFLTNNSSNSFSPATPATTTTASTLNEETLDQLGNSGTDDGYDVSSILREPIGASAD